MITLRTPSPPRGTFPGPVQCPPCPHNHECSICASARKQAQSSNCCGDMRGECELLPLLLLLLLLLLLPVCRLHRTAFRMQGSTRQFQRRHTLRLVETPRASAISPAITTSVSRLHMLPPAAVRLAAARPRPLCQERRLHEFAAELREGLPGPTMAPSSTPPRRSRGHRRGLHRSRLQSPEDGNWLRAWCSGARLSTCLTSCGGQCQRRKPFHPSCAVCGALLLALRALRGACDHRTGWELGIARGSPSAPGSCSCLRLRPSEVAKAKRRCRNELKPSQAFCRVALLQLLRQLPLSLGAGSEARKRDEARFHVAPSSGRAGGRDEATFDALTDPAKRSRTHPWRNPKGHTPLSIHAAGTGGRDVLDFATDEEHEEPSRLPSRA